MSDNRENTHHLSVADIKAVFEKIAQDAARDDARRDRRVEDILHSDVPTFGYRRDGARIGAIAKGTGIMGADYR